DPGVVPGAPDGQHMELIKLHAGRWLIELIREVRNGLSQLPDDVGACWSVPPASVMRRRLRWHVNLPIELPMERAKYRQPSCYRRACMARSRSPRKAGRLNNRTRAPAKLPNAVSIRKCGIAW